jgi:hypothetical protein
MAGNANSGRLTKEKQAERDAAKLAECKARNQLRHREAVSKANSRDHFLKSYKDKSTSKELEAALTRILKKFCEDIKGKPLLDLDLYNKDSVQRRKDQLAMYKDTMAVIRQMRELISVLSEDEVKGLRSKPMSADNLILLEEARELLKEQHVEAEI